MGRDYDLQLTPEAEETYRRLYRKAKAPLEEGNHSNGHVKMLRMVDELLDSIIPHNPLNRARALSGPLKDIYRVKKARIRICYLVSAAQRRIVVL